MTEGARVGSRRVGTLIAVAAAVLLVTASVVGALAVTGRLPGSGTCGPLEGHACTRVLFLGNSYTDVNDLPHVFAELAASGGEHVGTRKVAPGGEDLSGHLTRPETRAALDAGPWDVVVLQEQSQVPASEQLRSQAMEPAARSLVATIRALGARPILLETWAHRDGWPENGQADYGSMQAAIEASYLAVAGELGVPVAPAGAAWRMVRLESPGLDLWQPDGSHPTTAGTYLAACVLYATIFQRSPVGLRSAAGLPSETAQLLQSAAAHTVLDDPARWQLP